MGRNRVVGSPLQIQRVQRSVPTRHDIDVYAVQAPIGSPVTVTLDPSPADGDEYTIEDAGFNAGQQPIAVVSSGPAIGGYGSATNITSPGGIVTVMYSAQLGMWIARVGFAATTGGLSVANTTALAQVDDTHLNAGAECFVVSVQVPYVLTRAAASSLRADASRIKYVATLSGNGTWVQSDAGAAVWQIARTWNVDPVAGNDEADGTLAAPMQSITGVNRRLGMGSRPKLPFITTVQYSGATCAEDISVDADLQGRGVYQLQFVPQVVHTGTFTAGHLPQEPFSLGEDITITDPAIVSWTPYLASNRFRVDITSGAAAGFSFWVMKDLGSGTARITYVAQWGGELYNPVAGHNATPTYPCTYNVVALTHVTGSVVDEVMTGYDPTPPVVTLGPSRFELHDCAIDAWLPQTAYSTVINSFVNVADPVSSISYAVNCCFGVAFVLTPGIELDTFSGGFLNTALYIEGKVLMDEGPIFQSATMPGQDTSAFGGELDVHERGGFFDIHAPLRVESMKFRIGVDGIFGNGSTSALFQVAPNAWMGIEQGARLMSTTTAAVEVIWGTGAETTSTKAKPYDPQADTLGVLTDTTFAAIMTQMAAGGGFRRESTGSSLVLMQNTGI